MLEFFQNFQNKFLEDKIFKENFFSHSKIINEGGILKEEFYPINAEPEIKQILSYHLFPDKSLILGKDFSNTEKARGDKYQDWFVKILSNLYKRFVGNNYIWLPTKLPEFCDILKNNFPNHNLILYDFDFLNSNVFNNYNGKFCPVVYSIVEGSTDVVTQKSLFYDEKPVNIYFPIDFSLVQFIYKMRCNKIGTINKFKYFMQLYAFQDWTETKTGFNPLFDTHHNSSFLLTLD